VSFRSIFRLTRSPRVIRLPVFALLVAIPVAAARFAHDPVISMPNSVRDSLNSVWTQANLHWNEISDQNTLTQALGTGKPTQKEYLGCLIGDTENDTFHVIGWIPAHDMKRFQFAVTGSCDSVPGAIGTFHTHPYRAAPTGEALKEPGLSQQDLKTFTGGTDRVLIVVWDVDSLDVALRASDGRVVHPAVLVPR
jgi:proteasome lid subunit RPN8/RPN11